MSQLVSLHHELRAQPVALAYLRRRRRASMLEGCVPVARSAGTRATAPRVSRGGGLWEDSRSPRWSSAPRAGSRRRSRLSTASAHRPMTSWCGRRSAWRAVCSNLGLQPLDRVVVQLPNGLEFVSLYLALNWIGVDPGDGAARASPRRGSPLHARLRRASPMSSPIASAPSTTGRWRPRWPREFPSLRHVIVAGEPGPGQIALPRLSANGRPRRRLPTIARPDPSEVATMLLSGGTTSLSKLIPTHPRRLRLQRPALRARPPASRRDTVFMAMLPLGHNYNLASPGLLGAFHAGGTRRLAAEHRCRRCVRVWSSASA